MTKKYNAEGREILELADLAADDIPYDNTASGLSGDDVQEALDELAAGGGGGSTIPTTVQGDTLYASATNVLSALAKDANATRYLSNTGASNNPAWAQVALATGVSGDLPFANLTQIAGLSVLGVTGNVLADVAAITAGTDNQVLRRSGTALAFGAVNLASANAITGDLPFANLTQLAARSLLGVAGNATADVAAITAATDNQVMRRSGTSIAFGAVNLASSDAVTGLLADANLSTNVALLNRNPQTFSGAVNNFSTVRIGDGTITAPTFAFVSATTVGIYYGGAASPGVYVVAPRLRVIQNSNTEASRLSAQNIHASGVSTIQLVDETPAVTWQIETNNSTNVVNETLAVNRTLTTNATLRWSLENSTGHYRAEDNVQIQLGAGADLIAYHNATNSFITNATGDLTISSTQQLTITGSTEVELNATTIDVNGILDSSSTAVIRGTTSSTTVPPLRVGQDSGTATALSAMISAVRAGLLYFAVRNSSDSIEGFLGCSTTNVQLGSATNHPVVLQVNAATVITITAAIVEATTGISSSSTVPFWRFVETDEAADGKLWFMFSQAGLFSMSAATDLEAHSVYLQVSRSGGVATQVTLSTSGTAAVVVSSAGAIQFNAYGAGTLQTDASGNITAVSDENMKSDIKPYLRSLLEIGKLKPILYHWAEASGNDMTTEYAGFGAHDVLPWIPEAVGRMTPKYGGSIPVGPWGAKDKDFVPDPNLYIQGPRTLQDRPIIAALCNAIEEVAVKVNHILMTRPPGQQLPLLPVDTPAAVLLPIDQPLPTEYHP